MYLPAGISDDEDSDEFESSCATASTRFNSQYRVQNKENDKESAVETAAANGDLETLRKILENGCNINIDLCLNGSWTALMHACFNVQLEVIRYLLDLGANPNAHSESITPLQCVCSYTGTSEEIQLQCLRMVIEKGALINMGDKFGLTPLMKLVELGRVRVVEELINLGANIEMRDSQGWTAIFWAVNCGNLDTVRFLVEKGARLQEVDKKGRSLIDLTLTEYHQPVAEYLNTLAKTDDDNFEKSFCFEDNKTWSDYFPGILPLDKQPEYSAEIPTLLYAMHCESLIPLFKREKLSLRKFLLLDEEAMNRIGVLLPYERKRLKIALYKFHQAKWKVESVAGLDAITLPHFDIMTTVNTLGSHVRQLYILEASVQYAITNFVQPFVATLPRGKLAVRELDGDLKEGIKEMNVNLSNLKKEIKNLKIELQKMLAKNPPPIDLIRPTNSNPNRNMGILFTTIGITAIGFAFAKSYILNK